MSRIEDAARAFVSAYERSENGFVSRGARDAYDGLVVAVDEAEPDPVATALVALGETRIDYAIEAGSFYGSDGEQRHGARWDALNYDRFASLKAQAKEVLGG